LRALCSCRKGLSVLTSLNVVLPICSNDVELSNFTSHKRSVGPSKEAVDHEISYLPRMKTKRRCSPIPPTSNRLGRSLMQNLIMHCCKSKGYIGLHQVTSWRTLAPSRRQSGRDTTLRSGSKLRLIDRRVYYIQLHLRTFRQVIMRPGKN
jgi:hypothetical protein